MSEPETTPEPLTFERCKPSEILALCHMCYRNVGRNKELQYTDFTEKCKDSKYRRFVDWWYIAYRKA